ncbi:MAG: hypothetical protein LBT30_08115 [Clostridiales bacterium]|jgi:hypothetical protein|nr:hypothetical protein [Clostridiales bacterium]
MTEVMELKKSNLVLPKHFVELDREEMCYVEGGAYISNGDLWKIVFAISIVPIPAVLIAMGVYKVVSFLMALGAKLGAMLGSWGGPIGTVIGGIIGLGGISIVALPFAEALIFGKGMDFSLKYFNLFGKQVPYGFSISAV